MFTLSALVDNTWHWDRKYIKNDHESAKCHGRKVLVVYDHRLRAEKAKMKWLQRKLYNFFTPAVFVVSDRWGCIPAPLRWHVLRSLPWVRAWGQSCGQVSTQTQETRQSLHLYSRLCSDAPLSVFLQICHNTKLQLCGEWFLPSDSSSSICPFGWGSFSNYLMPKECK